MFNGYPEVCWKDDRIARGVWAVLIMVAGGIITSGSLEPAAADECPDSVIAMFNKIAAIPRCSGCEQAIVQWMQVWAAEHGFDVKTDPANNLCISVPASPGREDEAILILQGHLDIVCVKTDESTHDFARDPIEVVQDGDWLLSGSGTTLGADDGIGLALAMVLAIDPDVSRPPLELLFTANEEKGTPGASALEPGFVKGRRLVNLDSEDEGILFVGCAGMCLTNIDIPAPVQTIGPGCAASRIRVDGLQGGHSGLYIAENRANAIKLLARVLANVLAETPARLLSIEGGVAANAIPSSAEAVIIYPTDAQTAVKAGMAASQSVFQTECGKIEPGLTVNCIEYDQTLPENAMTTEDTQRIVRFLLAYPHGVYSMSADFPGLPQTSNNLGIISTGPNAIHAVGSQRSFVQEELKSITQSIEALVELAGSVSESDYTFPPWKPNMDSPLLAHCKQVYEKRFGKLPTVTAVHAGLECAIIAEKYEGMEAISLGPTLQNGHSPSERVSVSATGKVWQFMVDLLSTASK